MLEKIFGKKTTGIIYLICTGLLVLLLAAFILSYLITKNISVYALINYAVFILFSIAIITLPVIVQKKFKLFIPPFLQAGLCVYAVLYLLDNLIRTGNTGTAVETHRNVAIVTFLPAVGGFFIAAVVFSLVYTLSYRRAVKKDKKISAWAVSLLTFLFASIAVALLNGPSFFLSLTPPTDETVGSKELLYHTAGYQHGVIAFCIVGWITVRSRNADKYRIRSFKDPEHAKSEALSKGNKTLYTVIENIDKDTTDYKKIFRKAKTKFLFVRILYLIFYAVYLVFTGISFYKTGGIGYAVIGCLCIGFILTAAVYIYEYDLFRKDALNQRLRKLKIARTAVRIYSLMLMFGAMFVADYHYDPLAALVSIGMAVFNLCVLFYNLFGKPRHYPSSKSAENTEGAAETDDKLSGAAK